MTRNFHCLKNVHIIIVIMISHLKIY